MRYCMPVRLFAFGVKDHVFYSRKQSQSWVLSCLLTMVLMWLASCARVAHTPLPFTLQSGCVLMLAMTLPGSAVLAGVLSVYLSSCLGFFGLATPAALTLGSPALGYLVGFLWAAYYLQALEDFSKSILFYAFSAQLRIWTAGFLGLMLCMSPWEAWHYGVAPYLLVDSIKVLAAVGVVRGMRAIR